ncbi:MAG: tape measure protein [Nitrospinae bacterium]|nr:tape measure protein [Nitrospinota bacterium]
MVDNNLEIKISADTSQLIAGVRSAQTQITATTQKLADSAKNASSDIDKAWAALGSRSSQSIQSDIRTTVSAYNLLARSGKASSDELARAAESAKTRIAELNAEISRNKNGQSFNAIGVRTDGAIQTEIARIQAAYKSLAASGSASAGELARAQATANQKIAELRQELSGVHPAAGAAELSIARYAQGLIAVSTAYAILRGSMMVETEVVAVGAKFESLNVQMKAVAGGAAEGRQAMQWLIDFNKRTPYELEDVTRGFMMLKNAGLDPYTGSLEGLTAAASKAGGGQEKLQRVLLAVTQMWAKGKITSEEMTRQLTETGIPAWDLLSKSTGKSVAELMKLAETGDLGRDALAKLIKALGEWGGSAATEQMATYAGQLSNVKDNWTLLLNEVAKNGPLLETTKILKTINDQAGASNDGITNLARSAGQSLASPLVVLNGWVDGFRSLNSSTDGWAEKLVKINPIYQSLNSFLNPIRLNMEKLETLAFGLIPNYARIADEHERWFNRQQKVLDSIQASKSALAALAAVGLDNSPLANSIKKIQADMAKGLISPENAAKAVADIKMQSGQALEAAKLLTDKKAQLAQLEVQMNDMKLARITTSERAAKENIGALDRDSLNKRIANIAKELDAIHQKCAQAERLETELAAKLGRIQKERFDLVVSIEDEIRAKQREGMPEAEAQADLKKQIDEKLSQSAKALAASEYDVANARGAEARALAGQIKDRNQSIEKLKEVGSALDNVKAAQEKEAASAVEAQKKIVDELAQRKDEIEAIKKQLEEGLTVRLISDTQQARDELDSIQKMLSEITDKTVTVTVKTVEAKAGGGLVGATVPGYAGGGNVTGPGGTDTIPAMLTAGEYVQPVRAVQHYGHDFMEALRQRIIPRSAIGAIMKGIDVVKKNPLLGSEQNIASIMSYLAPHTRHYAEGGSVATASHSQGAGSSSTPFSGDTVRIEINMGAKKTSVFAQRDQARAFANMLNEISRGAIA